MPPIYAGWFWVNGGIGKQFFILPVCIIKNFRVNCSFLGSDPFLLWNVFKIWPFFHFVCWKLQYRFVCKIYDIPNVSTSLKIRLTSFEIYFSIKVILNKFTFEKKNYPFVSRNNSSFEIKNILFLKSQF